MMSGLQTPLHLRRVVVTGAAGFLGSHLCERLVAVGSDVVGIDNLSTGRVENLSMLSGCPGFRLLVHDLTDPLDVPGAVHCVFHLASPASPRDYLRLPVETLTAGAMGTSHALQLAARTRARFVLASTSEVYDEAKRFAEALTAAYRRERGVDTAIVRIFNTYGPRMRPDDGRAVPEFIRQCLSGLPMTVTGDGSQTRSLCFVSDLIDGLLAMAAHDAPGPVNLGNPQEITVLELARRIRDLCDSPSPMQFVARRTDDPTRRCPDISLARHTLTWSPQVNLRDGLRRTIAAARDASTCATTPAVSGVRVP